MFTRKNRFFGFHQLQNTINHELEIVGVERFEMLLNFS